VRSSDEHYQGKMKNNKNEGDEFEYVGFEFN
jgi:hypothetical protein